MNPIQSTAGRTEQQPDGYLAFMPNVLPPNPPLQFSEGDLALQSSASDALARLASIADQIPNVDLFGGMYVRKEALLSSQIEGIECTLDDVIVFEETDEPNAPTEIKDVAQVVNHVRAANLAFARLDSERPSLQLIRDVHAVLMEGVPDVERRGQFRERQNWIGAKRADTTVRNARFVPPPPERMNMALVNLEYYVVEQQTAPPIVRAAIAHSQFETIHPFLDGNGRVGRMLVALILKDQKVLQHPLLYLSLFFKDNRNEYYDRLTDVREKGDWIGWINFFARGVRHTAEEALQTSAKIIALRRQSEVELAKMPKGTQRIGLQLFAHPIVDARAVQRHTGLGFEGADNGLKRLESAGWVEEITGQRRGKTYRFTRYLSILEGAGENDPGLRTRIR
jgi:Fic family protein